MYCRSTRRFMYVLGLNVFRYVLCTMKLGIQLISTIFSTTYSHYVYNHCEVITKFEVSPNLLFYLPISILFRRNISSVFTRLLSWKLPTSRKIRLQLMQRSFLRDRTYAYIICNRPQLGSERSIIILTFLLVHLNWH